MRDAWRNDTFGREFEAKILDLFPGVLAQVDHRNRMERFCSRRVGQRLSGWQVTPSKAYVLSPRRALRSARRRTMRRRRLRRCRRHCDMRRRISSPRRAFCVGRTSWTKRPVLADVSRDPDILADGDGWWAERRLIARKLLDRGDALAAYAIVREHAAKSAEKRVDAEFHAGWIALRFLNHPATAARHFADAAKIAESRSRSPAPRIGKAAPPRPPAPTMKRAGSMRKPPVTPSPITVSWRGPSSGFPRSSFVLSRAASLGLWTALGGEGRQTAVRGRAPTTSP